MVVPTLSPHSYVRSTLSFQTPCSQPSCCVADLSGLQPIGLIVPCAECNWKHERNGTGQAVEAMECLAAAGHDPSGTATFLQIGLQDQTWQTDCLLNGVFLTDFTERLGDFGIETLGFKCGPEREVGLSPVPDQFAAAACHRISLNTPPPPLPPFFAPQTTTTGVAYGVYTSVDDYVAIICPTLGSYAWNLWYEAYDGVPDTATWKAFGSFVQPFAKAYAANATACGATFDLSVSSYPYW